MSHFDPDKEIKNPTWTAHIRHFFTPFQIKRMKWFCDLGKYEDVAKYSSKIYERVIAPQDEHGMPPKPKNKEDAEKDDYKPWSNNKKNTFHNWMKNGTPKDTNHLA